MYRQFNIQQFYVLPTQCTYVFCVDLRTNSHYFPIQHELIGFYNRDLTLYNPVVTICTASLTFNNSAFCPHSVFMCFVWISEQTAIISKYSINWLVFTTKRSVFTARYGLRLCIHGAVQTTGYRLTLRISNTYRFPRQECLRERVSMLRLYVHQWRTEGVKGVQPPPPEIPKTLQNRAKVNPIVKTVKNCRI